MKHYILQATNWEHGIVGHVGIFPETEIDEALVIAFENHPPFTAFHTEEVKYYDKAQSLREAIHVGHPKETANMQGIPIR